MGQGRFSFWGSKFACETNFFRLLSFGCWVHSNVQLYILDFTIFCSYWSICHGCSLLRNGRTGKFCLRSCLFQQLEWVETFGVPPCHQIDYMLHLEKHLKCVKPHHLLWSGVGREHKSSLFGLQVEQVFQVWGICALILDFYRFFAVWILEFTRNKLLHLTSRKGFLGRFGVFKGHWIEA